jgi:hypothetical protein
VGLGAKRTLTFLSMVTKVAKYERKQMPEAI